jgi:ketosteroid isomerase-like protein
MSQQDVELARAYHDEVARASHEGPAATVSKMVELWHPDVEYDMSESPALDIGGVYRGIAACRRFWQEWFSAWETLRFEYRLVDAGDRVVVLLDSRLRGRSTGIELLWGKHAFITTFRDGLMVHARLYTDQSDALKAVGLWE